MTVLRPPHTLLACAVIGAALFTIESWALGPYSWIYGYGSGLETIPVLLALSQPGANFAHWAPFVAGGVDRLAFWGNADPISIEVLMFAHLPVWLANGLHRFLQYLIGIYFTARILREDFSFKDNWAAFGGLLFGAFSYFTVGALFTLPGIPVLAWAVSRLTTRQMGPLPWLALAVAASLATTFTFGVPYLLVFSALWLVLLRAPVTRRNFVGFLVFAFTLILLESPQLWAVLANAPDSHRASWTSEQQRWSIDGLFYRQLQFDLFAQDKILDVVTRLLPLPIFIAGSLFALLRLRSSEPAVSSTARNYLKVSALFLLLSQKWLWLSLQSYVAAVLPWAQGIYMGRFFELPAAFLIAIALAHLALLIWQAVMLATARRFLATAAALFLIFMILEPKRQLFEPLALGDWGQANYDVPAIRAIKASHEGPIRVVSVLPLQPAYAYAQGVEAADGWANLYPKVYRDLWLRVLEPLFNEIPATATIFGRDSGRAEDNFIFLGAGLSLPGVGKLNGEDPFTAIRSGFDMDRRFNLDLLRLLGVDYLLSEYPLTGNGLRLVHEPHHWPDWPQARDRNTGLVNGPLRPLPAEWKNVTAPERAWLRYRSALEDRRRGKDIFAYRLEHSVSRVRIVRNIIIAASDTEALDRVSRLSGVSISSTAVVKQADAAVLTGKSFKDGTGRLTGYGPDILQIEAGGSGQRFLVIANTWSPYWHATADGHKRLIVRVNQAQLGVVLEPGDRNLVVRYDPPYAIW